MTTLARFFELVSECARAVAETIETDHFWNNVDADEQKAIAECASALRQAAAAARLVVGLAGARPEEPRP